MDLFKEAVDALLVDTLGGFENVEIDADCSGQVNKCLEILWGSKIHRSRALACPKLSR